MRLGSYIVIGIGLTTLSALADQAPPMRFSDQTTASGFEYTHDAPSDHQSGTMVGGGAVGDFNNDGYPDVFVLGSGGTADGLFINNRNGTFSNRVSEWNVEVHHRGVGATVGDYDGDGDDDIYVTSYGPTSGVAGSGKHRLYRNDGDSFTNVAEAAGVATTTTTHPDGYGATFGDYDLDGDLDLFVGAWHSSPVLGARLFRNDGDGTFTNVTQQAGIITASTRAFGAIWSDMDGDRYPELLIAGDFGSNRYYRNNKDGTFTERDPGSGLEVDPETSIWTVGKAHNGMGTAVGDFNRDGLMDWFVTAIWPTAHFDSDFWGNGLYINHGDHIFTEVSQGAGVNDGGWGWGTEAKDFDNDGWSDLVMTNGWPFTDPITQASFTNERSYLWRNRGDLTFAEVGVDAGLSHDGQGRALLTLDYDRDGDLDIVILSNNESAQLFRNDLKIVPRFAQKNWLQVALDTSEAPSLAPKGIGARITLASRGMTQTQQVTTGASYLGQSELLTHFGLGELGKIESITVDWADGRQTRINRIRANQRLTIRIQDLQER